MPKRQSVKKINSDEVQGEGSYIVITSPKVKEMDKHRKELKPAYEKMQKLNDSNDTESLEYLELSEQIETAGRDLIIRFVKEWNWVDDDENPLPPPHEEGVLNMLTLQELKWLSAQFSVSISEKKE